MRKNFIWTIRVNDLKHNHIFLAVKAFAIKRKFCQTNIAIIKDNN